MINNILNDAIILAGGKGTRLANVLNGKPKPLVEIGGIPLLKHQVDLLIKFNINNIYLLVNYKANLIKKYLEDEYNNNINFIILEDGAHALGTGGSIIKHLTSFSDRFLVLYGDTFLNIDFARFFTSIKPSPIISFETNTPLTPSSLTLGYIDIKTFKYFVCKYQLKGLYLYFYNYNQYMYILLYMNYT